WKTDQIIEKISEINDKWRERVNQDLVRVIGQVSENEKWALLKQASLFLYVSYEEGFGLPVLEAMASGVPVITSNDQAIKEIAAETVIYVEPEDIENMTLALAQCLLVPEGTRLLTEAAKKRAQQFSWDKAAEQTLQVLESCSQ
ncbi:glycosyltransferase, partial [Patescibacteria group bacterium]